MRSRKIIYSLIYLDRILTTFRQLSGNALDALKEFYAERDAREKQFEDLKAAAEAKSKAQISMDTFAESWQDSQFWVRELQKGEQVTFS